MLKQRLNDAEREYREVSFLILHPLAREDGTGRKR